MVLFAACLYLAHLCQQTFGAVAIWPANGVLAAALLLLHRREAITVFVACLLLNLGFNILVRTNPLDTALTFSLLNGVEAFGVAIIARRVCGAGLALGRPIRLLHFAVLAAAPPVIVSAILGLATMNLEPGMFGLYFASWVSTELLSYLVVTPAIVILCQQTHRHDEKQARAPEGSWLILGAGLFTAAVCLRVAPLPVATVLPVLLLIALRLSPRQAAVTALLTSAIATTTFLVEHTTFEAFGFGAPGTLTGGGIDITRRLPSFYVFLASILTTIYAASTVVSEKAWLQSRLQRRAVLAREDAQRLAVAARLANQATEAKQRFLGMISHELRTPLGQVAGYASIIATEDVISDSARDRIGKITLANAHALDLVEDMIDFARADLTLDMQAFDLGSAVGSMLDNVRASIRRKPLQVRFENQLAPSDLYIGDARRLRQLLRLLIHNAAKFTERGEIGIEAESTQTGTRLTVFDTGPGMDVAQLPELTDAFCQGDGTLNRRKEGAGIGLALAQRLLVAMGGEWTFHSELGIGTRIVLDIPMERVAKTVETAEPEEENERAPRVLVVDDHPANREILTLMLTAFGCETVQADDGVQAVQAARETAFDVILMDLRMPIMDGFEASRQIRLLPGPISKAPILAVSAESRTESLQMCREVGIDDFLAKPVSQNVLLGALTTWLDPETARAQNAEKAA